MTPDNLDREDLQRRELKSLLSLGLSGSDAVQFLKGTWGMEEPEALRVLQENGYTDEDITADLDTGLNELSGLAPK